MAAQEYYLGTQSATELPGPGRPNLYPPPQQPAFQHTAPQPYPTHRYNTPGYASTPPPSYSSYSFQTPQNQHLGTHSPQSKITPYPMTLPATQHFPPPPPPPPPQNNNYPSAPLQPVRSHSQPPRVHFADQESDSGTSASSGSDSEASSRRRRQHRQRSHNHSRRRDRDYDSDYSGSEREREREREREHRHKTHRKGHKDRDTFLGAGAGTIIGDAILPGLGTAAGLLLGGYSGRKYAERSRSEEPSRHHRRRDGYRSERY